ncbi:hypothetical protein DFH06DRAFT_1144837 [Mycena polygramma]|nr:hypothetical protein DFH06DRAFT_1144837 [Mycena polygramma]
MKSNPCRDMILYKPPQPILLMPVWPSLRSDLQKGERWAATGYWDAYLHEFLKRESWSKSNWDISMPWRVQALSRLARSSMQPPLHSLKLGRTGGADVANAMVVASREIMLRELVDRDASTPGPRAHCGGCKTGFWSETDGGRRFFDCAACSSLLCYACCMSDHQQTPLHLLKSYQAQEWTGIGWQKITLAEIGLVFQLGHEGRQCSTPVPTVHSIEVWDTAGAQTVNFQYCGCMGAGFRGGQLAAAGWQISVRESVPDTAVTRSLLDKFSGLQLH